MDLITHPHEVSANWNDKYKIHVPKETDQLRDVTLTNILRLKFRIIQHLIAEENAKLKSATETADVDQMLDEISELKKIEISIAERLGNVTA